MVGVGDAATAMVSERWVLLWKRGENWVSECDDEAKVVLVSYSRTISKRAFAI